MSHVRDGPSFDDADPAFARVSGEVDAYESQVGSLPLVESGVWSLARLIVQDTVKVMGCKHVIPKPHLPC